MEKIKSVKEYLKFKDKYSVLVKVGKTHELLNGLIKVDFNFIMIEINGYHIFSTVPRGFVLVSNKDIYYESTKLISAGQNIPFFSQIESNDFDKFSVILDFRTSELGANNTDWDPSKFTPEFVVTAKFQNK